MKKILFVEDDYSYRHRIQTTLEAAGYDVVSTDNPIVALDLAEDTKFDLVISDNYMEQMSGLQLLKHLKRIDLNIKTILLTGVHSPEIELASLTIAIDQFIRKDSSVDVILKYIELLFISEPSIPSPQGDHILESYRENIVMNTLQYHIRKDGKEAKLTHKEFSLLTYFLSHKNSVLTREMIAQYIWEQDAKHITLRAVDTLVKLLRKKLLLNAIQSIRSIGYKWNE